MYRAGHLGHGGGELGGLLLLARHAAKVARRTARQPLALASQFAQSGGELADGVADLGNKAIERRPKAADLLRPRHRQLAAEIAGAIGQRLQRLDAVEQRTAKTRQQQHQRHRNQSGAK